MQTATTRQYKVGTRFVYDHWSRDLPENRAAISRRVSETSRSMILELDATGYDELMSDARYYADEMLGAGFDGHGLMTSARALVKALEKVGRP